MKTMEKEILESEARYLRMSLPYDEDEHLISFDDGVMTEMECDEDFTPPMLNADTKMLDFIVDLKERRVLDWNYEDGYLRMWAKVCDGGTYTLLDKDKNPIWQIRGYVPSKLIPPFEKGWGDYIELAVEADGTIADWPQHPDLSDFVEDGNSPKPIGTNKWCRAENALTYIRSKNLSPDELNWLIEALKVQS